MLLLKKKSAVQKSWPITSRPGLYGIWMIYLLECESYLKLTYLFLTTLQNCMYNRESLPTTNPISNYYVFTLLHTSNCY